MATTPVCRILLTLLLFGLSAIVCGQDYQLKDKVNLCDRRPGFEPNGEHLGNPGENLVVYTNWTNNSPTRVNRCLMRFSTCKYCRLQVRANVSFHYRQCHLPKAYKVYDGWCMPGCTYIHLYDQDYSNQTAVSFTSSGSLSSGNINFTTYSKYLYVIACANRTYDQHVFFSLKITAQDKTQYFKGKLWDVGRQYTFASPLFPVEYVLNSETYKYVFYAATQDDFITISFDDWQLSQHSSIQFDSANIKGKIWGSNSRPWIISDSRRLEMTFETGPYKIPGTLRAFKGFKANYTFHRNKDREGMPYVHTNCGSFIDRQDSGEITFNPKGDGQAYYDCIWVIKKHPSFQRVFIRVVNYSISKTYRNDKPNEMEIRRGLTSKGLVISAVPSSSPRDKLMFEDFDSDEGFYVRIKGHYWGPRDFVLSFTSFNMEISYNCRNLFTCTNGRCIEHSAKCNGVDNCGDDTDESYNTCGGGRTTTSPSGPNSVLSPVIIIPLVVILFAIVVICLLAIFIRRCRRVSCRARRAQRQQGNISTVSGDVSRQQRRRNRRRGEQRSDRGGDHYHRHHDPPPSYEDVLSSTPIGYLNLGFSDMTNASTGLIQPPSYDDAVTIQNPAFGFPSGDPNDESSDSSLPDTVRRSNLNISSSYSSDDTHRARADRRRQRGIVSSSSDSSNEGEGLGVEATERGRRGEGNERHREEDHRQGESRPTASGQGVVKPEDSAQIQLPICPSAEIAHHKYPKAHSKPAGGQENEDNIPAVITECLASASNAGSLSGPRSEGPATSTSTYRVEASPMISAASVSSGSTGDGHSASVDRQNDQQREGLSNPGAACLLPRADSSRESQSADHPQDTSRSQEARGRPSPGRKVPPHILKARSTSSHTLMKHLSQSLNDLDRQPSEERNDDHQPGSMPSRNFSRSMQNMLDASLNERPHRGIEQRPEANRHHHHRQSQTLPSQDGLNSTAKHQGRNTLPSQDGLNSTAQGRNNFFPPDGQTRRVRSEDLADRSQSRSDPAFSHRRPDGRQRDHVRPETLRTEGEGNQRNSGPPPSSSTRPKPQPKPRRLQHAEGRTPPEPRQRQSLEGYRYKPSEQTRSAESERGHPRNDRNPQSMPGYPKGGGSQAKASRPPAPSRPERSARSSASRGPDPPRRPDLAPSTNSERAQFDKDGPPSSSQGYNSGPPYRHADPPPYRPRHNKRPSRPTSLHGTSGGCGPRPDHPPHSTQMSPRQEHPPHSTQRSGGSLPRMEVQAVPRSGHPAEGTQGSDPHPGTGTGAPPAAHSHNSPNSPHRPGDSAVMASSGGVWSGAAPILSLQMDGEVEDIYV
ncbi:hypothetical protein ACOMHN_010951 [Nucella lapillus]